MEKLLVGKTIKMPCMRKGLCGYEKEIVLLQQPALERLAKTIFGIPVVIDHTDVDSGNVAQVAVGRVADMHYNVDDDTWDAHFVVDDAVAADLLMKGYGVSTAYAIKEVGPGGSLNNVQYNREVLDGTYLHLAIVQTPRYEMARNPTFYNSKGAEKGCVVEADKATIVEVKTTGMRENGMLGKIWRRVKEQIMLNAGDADEYFVEVDGKETKLSALVGEMKQWADVKKAEADAATKRAEAEKKRLNGEDEVEVDGEKMSVNELVKRHSEMKKSNEKPAEEKKPENEKPAEEKPADEKKPENEKPAEEKPADEKKPENEKETDEEKKKEEDEEKKNAAEEKERFETMNNAAEKAMSVDDMAGHLTLRERTEAGRSLYGTRQ